MFERYTEQARRLVFFARYEASALNSTAIDTEHLLLGVLREGAGITGQILRRAGVTYAMARKEVEGPGSAGHPVSTSVDIPLTAAARRVLQDAHEEADRMHAEQIAVEHILLGLIREPEGIAGEILRAAGVQIDEAREEIRLQEQGSGPAASSGPVFQRLVEFLGQLEGRRASYHVVPFHGKALRVEIAVPDERWAATFFPDGRVTVEVFSLSSDVQDESSLARLLDRLGPEHQQEE